MSDGVKFRVGGFEVTLIWADDETLDEFDRWGCECEELHRLEADPRVKNPECKHVRKAKLAHWLDNTVTRVGEVERVE